MTLLHSTPRRIRPLIVSSLLLGGLLGLAGCAPVADSMDAGSTSTTPAAPQTATGGSPTASPAQGPDTPVPLLAGAWKLTSYSIVSPEFTLAYTPISGVAGVQIGGDGQATLTMDAVFTTVATGVDIPATEVTGTGEVDALIEADPTLSTIHWTSDPSSIGLTMTVDGEVIEGDEFSEDSRFEPMADMRLEVDGSRMRWIYDVEGGTGEWEWHR